MSIRTADFPFELKDLSDAGAFSGYGSVFNVLDSYDEIVAPGAFTESLNALKSANRMPAMLWQHRSAEPIGVYTSVVEDGRGLKLQGQLALDTVRGAEARSLMKMGALSGLSIGYITREDSFDAKTGVLTLKRVDLMEISLVTFPANDAARIQGVKSIEAIEDLKSAERYLRDAGGFSRKEAAAVIARIKALSQSDSDEGDLELIAAALKRRGEMLRH